MFQMFEVLIVAELFTTSVRSLSPFSSLPPLWTLLSQTLHFPLTSLPLSFPLPDTYTQHKCLQLAKVKWMAVSNLQLAKVEWMSVSNLQLGKAKPLSVSDLQVFVNLLNLAHTSSVIANGQPCKGYAS